MRFRRAVVCTRDNSGISFPVDDCRPSKEMLETEDVLLTMRKKLGREILLSRSTGQNVKGAHKGSSNPLVGAVHCAFSRHLPLVLSPDDVWLTILQGFSHHVHENAELLRGRLVRHKGRVTLTERIQDFTIDSVAGAIAGFSRQIREATDPVLHESLVCDFSTTTPDVRVAGDITLLDTYSRCFNYSMVRCVCGIPQITLTGSVLDWQRIRDRIEVLQTFGLEWWTARLRPILDHFVLAAQGLPDLKFWRGIYKFRPAKGPYDREMVTGWLVDLYPYLRDRPGRVRNSVFDGGKEQEIVASSFPSGLASVPVELKLVNDNDQEIERHELEFVAGFVGVQQVPNDAAVAPAISWCLVRRRNPTEDSEESMLNTIATSIRG